jgi:hypothetical protein
MHQNMAHMAARGSRGSSVPTRRRMPFIAVDD